MKHITYILLTILLLTGCQQEELLNNTGFGVLSIGSIQVADSRTQQITTKAVETDLYVEIWKDGGLFANNKFNPGQVPSSIDLPAGSYQLVSYNQAYLEQETWTNEQMGAPAYYKKSEPFVVQTGEVNHQTLEVPMVNVGVRLDANLPAEFTDYKLSVKVGNRQVVLTPDQSAYFPIVAGDNQIVYTLRAKNADQEERFSTSDPVSPVAGTVYTLSYQLEELEVTEK